MIKYIGSKTGAYVWEIDGVQLTLGFNKQVEREKYHRGIREFKKVLSTRAYRTSSATLKSLFSYFGCVPFFRIGMESFRIPFLDMCHHFAKEYVEKEYHRSGGSFLRIPSFGYVLTDMVRWDRRSGLCSFGMLSTYEKVYRDRLSRLMCEEFDAFCGEQVAAALSAGGNLKEAVGKIGLTRVTRYCMDFAPKLTERMINAIASDFTERRTAISLYGVQTA